MLSPWYRPLSSYPSYAPHSRIFCEMRAIAQPKRRACSFIDSEGNESEILDNIELDRRARCVGAALQGFEARGRRALLLHPPGLDFVAAYLGCLYSGTIAVPVEATSPKRPSNRLLGIAEDSGATVVLALADDLEAWRERIPLPDADWIATDAIDLGLADSWRDPEVELGELASLQYTSGSLGDPKGVMLSHGNLVQGLEVIRQRFDHSSECCVVSWLPHHHDMGLVGGILQPLYVGFPTVLMSPISFMKRPILWLEAITRFRATSSGAPNFAFEHCVRRIPAERRAQTRPEQLAGRVQWGRARARRDSRSLRRSFRALRVPKGGTLPVLWDGRGDAAHCGR